MKIALFAAFICLAAALPKVRQVHNLDSPHRVAGEFLIVLHRPAGRINNVQHANGVAAKIAAISSKVSVINSFTNLVAPILHVKTTDESVMSQLFQIDEIDMIDVEMYQNMIEQCSTQDTGSRLWGLSRVSSREAPNYSTARMSYNSRDGAGVRVYILDTSIRTTHNDFGGRAVFGADFTNSHPGDNNGHGTHCAGTATGGEFGVAKAATVVAVKVLGDSGSGSFAGIINGINWVMGDVGSGQGVISMSLGGGFNTGLNSAVNSADAAGIPVVTSAGNSNSGACTQSPASAEQAITVGATDNTDTLSSFSNYGDCMDIMAPGSSILSASHLSDTGTRTLSGTSMSCPHVAGWVAKYMSDNPGSTPAQVKAFIASESTKNAINLRGVSNTVNYMMYSSCA